MQQETHKTKDEEKQKREEKESEKQKGLDRRIIQLGNNVNYVMISGVLCE